MAARNHREARASLKRLIQAEEISWTTHAKQRMLERNVTSRDVLRVLQAGHEVEGPIRNERMNWTCTFAGNSAGIGVQVVAVLIEDSNETCLVVTVID